VSFFLVIRFITVFEGNRQHYGLAEASSQSLENASARFLTFAHACKRRNEEAQNANNARNENEMPEEKKRKLTISASPTN